MHCIQIHFKLKINTNVMKIKRLKIFIKILQRKLAFVYWRTFPNLLL